MFYDQSVPISSEENTKRTLKVKEAQTTTISLGDRHAFPGTRFRLKYLVSVSPDGSNVAWLLVPYEVASTLGIITVWTCYRSSAKLSLYALGTLPI